MLLTIHNWPPLASHFLCLFIGAVFAHWQPHPQVQKVSYPRQKAVIAFTKAYLTPALRDQDSKRREVGFAQLHPDSQQPYCRIRPEFVTLMQTKPFPVIRVKTNELTDLNQVFLKGKAKSFQIVPLEDIAMLPLCNDKPRVTYGTKF